MHLYVYSRVDKTIFVYTSILENCKIVNFHLVVIVHNNHCA